LRDTESVSALVKALAVSYERIHRSNLVGMGVLPLVLPKSWTALGLTGEETFDIPIGENVRPRSTIEVAATKPDGIKIIFPAKVRIDTPVELDYYRNGGILQTVLRKLMRG
jgi:aconitate hydratase